MLDHVCVSHRSHAGPCLCVTSNLIQASATGQHNSGKQSSTGCIELYQGHQLCRQQGRAFNTGIGNRAA